MADEIETKVIKIVSELLGVDANELTTECKFIDDLNCDSLDAVELVMEFEDHFELDIPDEVMERLSTVGDAIDYLRNAVAAKAVR